MAWRYKLRPLASLLPDRVLRFIERHWKLDYDPADGWTFWTDASYYKWCRKDMRRAEKPFFVRYVGNDDYGIIVGPFSLNVPAGQIVIVTREVGQELVANGEWEQVECVVFPS